MRIIAVAIGTLFLTAAVGIAEAKVECWEEDQAVQTFNGKSGSSSGSMKKCSDRPVSPPGNPGNNKPVGNAGEKGDSNGDKGKSNANGWNPKANKS